MQNNRYRLFIIMILTIMLSACAKSENSENNALAEAILDDRIDTIIGFGNLGVHSEGFNEAMTLINSELDMGNDIPGDAVMFFFSSLRNTNVNPDDALALLRRLNERGQEIILQAEGATGTFSCGDIGRTEAFYQTEIEYLLTYLRANGVLLREMSLDSALTFPLGWRGLLGDTSNCGPVAPQSITSEMIVGDIVAYANAVREIYPDIEFTVTYPIAYKYFAEAQYGLDPANNAEIFPALVSQYALLVDAGLTPTIEFDMPYILLAQYSEQIFAEINAFHATYPDANIAYVVNSQPWGPDLTTEQLTEQSRLMYAFLDNAISEGVLPLPDDVRIYSWTPNLTHPTVLELGREFFPR